MLKILSLILAILMFPLPSHSAQNIINLTGEVDDDMATMVVSKLNSMDGPVTIVINSPGGSVVAGLQIVSAIKHYDGPTTCVIDGWGDSMAAVIEESCTVREMESYSILMFHQGSLNIGRANSHDLVEAQKALNAVDRAMANIVAPRLGLTVDEWLQLIDGHDIWWSADMALKSHAIDKVIN